MAAAAEAATDAYSVAPAPIANVVGSYVDSVEAKGGREEKRTSRSFRRCWCIDADEKGAADERVSARRPLRRVPRTGLTEDELETALLALPLSRLTAKDGSQVGKVAENAVLVQAPGFAIDLARNEVLARWRRQLLPFAVVLLALAVALRGAVCDDLLGVARCEGKGAEPETLGGVGDDGAEIVDGIGEGDGERQLEEAVLRGLGLRGLEVKERLGRDEERHFDGGDRGSLICSFWRCG